MTLFTDRGAEFSKDAKYRFCLWRIWDDTKPKVMFVGLNPSTANKTDDDPTIRSVCRIAKHNGFGGVYMMNCFPLVSTDPSVLLDFLGTGTPYDTINLRWLRETADKCDAVVFAWGNFKVVKRTKRDLELSIMLPNAKALFINKNGSPKHPLYCKSDTEFVDYITQQKNT